MYLKQFIRAALISVAMSKKNSKQTSSTEAGPTLVNTNINIENGTTVNNSTVKGGVFRKKVPNPIPDPNFPGQPAEKVNTTTTRILTETVTPIKITPDSSSTLTLKIIEAGINTAPTPIAGSTVPLLATITGVFVLMFATIIFIVTRRKSNQAYERKALISLSRKSSISSASTASFGKKKTLTELRMSTYAHSCSEEPSGNHFDRLTSSYFENEGPASSFGDDVSIRFPTPALVYGTLIAGQKPSVSDLISSKPPMPEIQHIRRPSVDSETTAYNQKRLSEFIESQSIPFSPHFQKMTTVPLPIRPDSHPINSSQGPISLHLIAGPKAHLLKESDLMTKPNSGMPETHHIRRPSIDSETIANNQKRYSEFIESQSVQFSQHFQKMETVPTTNGSNLP